MATCRRLDGFQGELRTDPDEVQAVRWTPVAHVYRETLDQPQHFTAWFRAELAMLHDQLLDNHVLQPN